MNTIFFSLLFGFFFFVTTVVTGIFFALTLLMKMNWIEYRTVKCKQSKCFTLEWASVIYTRISFPLMTVFFLFFFVFNSNFHIVHFKCIYNTRRKMCLLNVYTVLMVNRTLYRIMVAVAGHYLKSMQTLFVLKL